MYVRNIHIYFFRFLNFLEIQLRIFDTFCACILDEDGLESCSPLVLKFESLFVIWGDLKRSKIYYQNILIEYEKKCLESRLWMGTHFEMNL